MGQFPESLQKNRVRHDHAHVTGHRLDDDTGNIQRRIGEGLFQHLDVVIGDGKGIFDYIFGHTRTAGNPQGDDPGTGLDQEGIGMPMVTAVKLDNQVAAGIAPGQPDGAHGSLGARVDKTALFHRGHALADQSGHLHLQGSGGTETGAGRGRLDYGLDHGRMCMSQNHGTPGTDKIDKGIAIHIGEGTAAGPGDKQGVAPDGAAGPNRRVDAAGDDGLGLGKEIGRLLGFHGHSFADV